MAAPYTSQSTSGYNSSPPADDGSAVASNQILWATIKTKLADVLKTFGENINSAVSTAFGRIPGGASISTTATSYQVLSADQGKLIIATASGITITTPDATSVSSPFLFRVLNNSSDTITIDGSGSQTIDGSLTVTLSAGAGIVLDTDGTNWFSNGTQGILAGKQLQYGDIINGTISESNGSNAVTYAVKTLAGADPSATDPVLVCFRNSTLATGNYIYRTITSATSLTISSGSSLGAINNVPFRVWLVLFDDSGTIRLGAINCYSSFNIYQLGQIKRASSTAEGGAGAADSALTFYTGTAVTNKAYVILGNATYESGLATAGSWNVSPTSIQLYGHGTPLPGTIIREAIGSTASSTTGSTQIPDDNTIPQITEGNEYMTCAITPTSAANLLDVDVAAHVSNDTATTMSGALFQDATANALVSTQTTGASVAGVYRQQLFWRMVAATSSSTTFRYRAGAGGAGTTTFNGASGGAKHGGTMLSYIRIKEVMI